MLKSLTTGGFAAACLAVGACAQDARTVTEPVIPPVCAVLDAQLTATTDGTYATLAGADETKYDTDRIQSAIDSCGRGKAVALRSKSAANAFLTGPLKLRGRCGLCWSTKARPCSPRSIPKSSTSRQEAAASSSRASNQAANR